MNFLFYFYFAIVSRICEWDDWFGLLHLMCACVCVDVNFLFLFLCMFYFPDVMEWVLIAFVYLLLCVFLFVCVNVNVAVCFWFSFSVCVCVCMCGVCLISLENTHLRITFDCVVAHTWETMLNMRIFKFSIRTAFGLFAGAFIKTRQR